MNSDEKLFGADVASWAVKGARALAKQRMQWNCGKPWSELSDGEKLMLFAEVLVVVRAVRR